MLAGEAWNVFKEGDEQLSFQRASYDKDKGVSCHYDSVTAIQSSAFINHGTLGGAVNTTWNPVNCTNIEACNFSKK